LNKPEANRHLKRIYKRLRESRCDVALNGKLGKCFGQITVDFVIKDGDIDFSHLIELNPYKSGKSFIKTVLHECLHLAYWNETEKQIRTWENEIFPLLSDRQLTNLLIRCVSSDKNTCFIR